MERTALETAGDEAVVSVEVTNTGTRAGEHVVQLYARDEEATVARPVLELCGFQRVALAAGECRTVTFRVSTEQFAHTDARYRRVVEPGRIRLFVGGGSAELPLEAQLTLVGPTVELVERQRYVSETSVS